MSDDQLTALYQYLQDEFGGINRRLDTVEGDISTMKGDIAIMKGDIATTQGDIVAMKGDIVTMQGDINQIYNILDKQGGILEDLQVEDTAATASHRRLEKQIQFVADKTGVDLAQAPA